MAKPAVKITATMIREAMATRWSAPEYAIMWEVADGTGAMAKRYADAVVMSLWPSRGLELHGVEIKVSRSDWRREAADPAKAEAVAKFCDRWWVHTAPGVVDDLSALPPAWGLREWDGKAWRTLREAEKTDAAPVSRTFLASMLRRADGIMKSMIHEASQAARDAAYQQIDSARRDMDKLLDERVKQRTKSLQQAADRVAEFEAAFGTEVAHGWGSDFQKLGKAAKALHDCGHYGHGPLAQRLRRAADEIDAIAALTGANPFM